MWNLHEKEMSGPASSHLRQRSSYKEIHRATNQPNGLVTGDRRCGPQRPVEDLGRHDRLFTIELYEVSFLISVENK